MRWWIAVLLVVFSLASYSDERCRADLRAVRDAVAQTGTFPHVPLSFYVPPKVSFGMYNLKEAPFYDPSAVYIGVANGKIQGNHHYYMLSDSRRVDGEFYRKVLVHEGTSNNVSASIGMIFKLKVDAETKAKIDEAMGASRSCQSLTCLHTTASILKAAGVHVPNLGEARDEITALRMGSALMTGEIYAGGKKIPVEALATNQEHLNVFLTLVDTIDEQMKALLMAPDPRAAAAALQNAPAQRP